MPVLRLSVVTFPESPKIWTARALEHDLAASARSPEAALDSLVKLARAQAAYDRRHGREPLSAFSAAPASYWHAFGAASRLSRPVELNWLADEGGLRIFSAGTSYHPGIARRPLPALSA